MEKNSSENFDQMVAQLLTSNNMSNTSINNDYDNQNAERSLLQPNWSEETNQPQSSHPINYHDYKDNSILSGGDVSVELFNKYKKQLKKFGKIKNVDFDGMDDDQKAFLFINFFKFIADEYFKQYGIKIESDEDCMTFGAILLATNKEFAKKLYNYVRQYVAYVSQLNQQKKFEQKKLKSLMEEASILIKFLRSNPTNATKRVFLLGGGGKNQQNVVGLAPFNFDPNADKRIKAYANIQKFLGTRNRLNGNKAKQVDPIISFKKTGYATILNKFTPETFYDLGPDDVINLLNNLTTEYCNQCNTPAPLVTAGTFLPCAEKGKVTYGANFTNANTIVFNEDVIKKGLNKFSETKDPRFPMRLMQTALHEAHHSVQESQQKDEYKDAKNSTGAVDYLGYAKDPKEKDARKASLNMLKKMNESGLLSKSLQSVLPSLQNEEDNLQKRIEEQTK